MKKIITFIMLSFCMLLSVSAQNVKNVRTHSNGGDNINITLQGGVLTTMPNMFGGHTACAPIIDFGVDKFITPVIGVGVDFRTLIGTGEVGMSRFNSKTAFDAINISGVVKANLANMKCFMPDGGYKYGRNWFEPIPYAQLGWGHNTSSDCPSMSINYEQEYNGIPTEMYGTMLRNRMTFRVGAELVFNLGEKRNLGIVVNPSVVWGNIDNGRLCKQNGQFELTAGLVWHFGTSNGTNHFTEPIPVMNTVTKEVEVVKEVVTTKNIITPEKMYKVLFAQNSAELSNEAKAILDKIPTDATVTVEGSTSPEGSVKRNTQLAQDRADSVAEYLKSKGVKVTSATSGENARNAIVTIQ